jgi:hypothetical protein
LVTEVVVCDPRHNKLLQSGNKNERVDARHDARDELAREQQNSTTEQEAVATWPFRNTKPLLEWHRNGQVATLYMKGRPNGSNLELL